MSTLGTATLEPGEMPAFPAGVLGQCTPPLIPPHPSSRSFSFIWQVVSASMFLKISERKECMLGERRHLLWCLSNTACLL